MSDMKIDRRNFNAALTAFAALIATPPFAQATPRADKTAQGATAGAAAPSTKPADAKPAHDMSAMPANWVGKEEVAFLIYPGFTALDMVGPHYMLSALMGAKTRIVAKDKAPVKSDAGLVFTPDASFDDCPQDLDIICVPGGTTGTLAAMQDGATLAFLKDRGARAKYVTSVCTGSLVLGAAGLLEGYKATSHWLTLPLLSHFGATPTDQRVVLDRNRVTGAGVTSGVDFGLTMLGMLRDKTYAEGMQLLAEYDPQPPYHAGSPKSAPKAVKEMMDQMFVGFLEKAEAAAKGAAKAAPKG